ncbi:MAG: YIP1 family protein [Armatimonadetes bacterium]|nr:YIP1 family protein [Armatimonadota bacterium]MDW8121522.1 YIP1 family protein [Armatimonadota bacterium]
MRGVGLFVGQASEWVSQALRQATEGVVNWGQSRFVQTFCEAWRWGLSAIGRPVPTLRRAADEKPILAALWLTILQGFSLAIGVHLARGNGGIWGSYVLAPIITQLEHWPWVLFYALVFPFGLWFIKAAILNLVAELLGGPPRGLSLLASTAVACSPNLLVLPVTAVCVWLAEPDLNTGFVGHFWFLYSIAATAWWVVLTVVSVRETYRFSLSQAILTLLLPFGVGMPLALIAYQVLRSAASS